MMLPIFVGRAFRDALRDRLPGWTEGTILEHHDQCYGVNVTISANSPEGVRYQETRLLPDAASFGTSSDVFALLRDLLIDVAVQLELHRASDLDAQPTALEVVQ